MEDLAQALMGVGVCPDVAHMIVMIAGFDYWSDIFLSWSQFMVEKKQFAFKKECSTFLYSAIHWARAVDEHVNKVDRLRLDVLSGLTSSDNDTGRRKRLFCDIRRPYTAILQQCGSLRGWRSQNFTASIPAHLMGRQIELFVFSSFGGELQVTCSTSPPPVIERWEEDSVQHAEAWKFTPPISKGRSATPPEFTFAFEKCKQDYIEHSHYIAVLVADIEAVQHIEKIFQRRKLLAFLPKIQLAIKNAATDWLTQCGLDFTGIPAIYANYILDNAGTIGPNLLGVLKQRTPVADTSDPTLPFGRSFLNNTVKERTCHTLTETDQHTLTVRSDGTCRAEHISFSSTPLIEVSFELHEGSWRLEDTTHSHEKMVVVKCTCLGTGHGIMELGPSTATIRGVVATRKNLTKSCTKKYEIRATRTHSSAPDNQFRYSIGPTYHNTYRMIQWKESVASLAKTSKETAANIDIAEMLHTILLPQSWIVPFF
ncbi:hypothetical protein Pelo_1767 [Pelomyxa schiedti]|nr:hypothetical protein Pelo_1767 [Pelomyxa schiedti]